MARAICGCVAPSGDAIIEIGPGLGALTRELSNLGQRPYLFEKDSSLGPGLERYTPKDRIYLQDALEVDFLAFCREHSLKKAQVVGNLPYNVSMPLFIKFLQVPFFSRMILMFQWEVALKIFDPSGGKKNRGRVCALAQNYCRIELLTHVSAASFFPRPKVDSGVLIFDRRDRPSVGLEEFSQFEDFLRKAFSQRRKQLPKVLSGFYPRQKVDASFLSCGLNPKARAEDLSLDEVRSLYSCLATP